VRNLAGWVWIAIISITRPRRTERVYHQIQTGYAIDEAWEVGNAPQGIAGAGSESLPGLPGTAGGSGS